MAFTGAEQATIREYMGWGARFAQEDTALERAMASLGGGAFPDEETKTRAHLAELARIDAAITACEARFKADKVGSIELAPRELKQLRSRGTERLGRLARQLGVEVRGNPFEPTLPTFRTGYTGPTGGGNSQMQG